MSEVTHLWRVIQEWLDAQRFPPSQSRLGESMGVTRSTISDWKLGNAKPTPEHLHRLADLLAPTLGPMVYNRLLEALLTDMGYTRERASGERAGQAYIPGASPGEVDVYDERRLRAAHGDEALTIHEEAERLGEDTP